ncbi:hypothetical protein OG417_20565 [Actinoallomurus sp. NBC_01490]|uniref:hypothetical protein n=1 Tax=Actinoallomurus sp. NBC_01490 TaxID=2903557 RepID=UPI002E319B4E|nr:hypothetical protein [Actinoallomurus sp. NBC_01490]
MHENIGLVNDLAVAMGVGPVDIKILLNTVSVPWKHLAGQDIYSRRHLIKAFRSGLVRTEKPIGTVTAQYSHQEAAERYRASLPIDGIPY